MGAQGSRVHRAANVLMYRSKVFVAGLVALIALQIHGCVDCKKMMSDIQSGAAENCGKNGMSADDCKKCADNFKDCCDQKCEDMAGHAHQKNQICQYQTAGGEYKDFSEKTMKEVVKFFKDAGNVYTFLKPQAFSGKSECGIGIYTAADQVCG